jgi:general secretion pathway protein A
MLRDYPEDGEESPEMRGYYHHFRLNRDPFLDTADPLFFCELPSVRKNARRVLGAVEESRGLTVVLGAPGTGKTSLSTHVEQTLLRNERVVVGKILDPSFANDVEFLHGIGRVYGLSFPPRSSAALKNALKNFFFDVVVLEEKTLVLIVDEAQNLTDDALETLRLLLNFQIPEKKLLNVLLFGQPELEEKIVRHGNLVDRVDTFVRVDALDRAASFAVIEHRLVRAGRPIDARIFAPDAIDALIDSASGLPRRIANIARGAMIEAADRHSETVFEDHVHAALRARGIPLPQRTVPVAPSVTETTNGAVETPSESFLSRLFRRAPTA